MSHFGLGVFLNKDNKSIVYSIGKALERYDENNKDFSTFHECDMHDIERYKNYKDKYPTLNDFLENYLGYIKNEEGKYGYWANDNAKWDWYVIGGRWKNILLKKDGTLCSYAQIKDIDWDTMKENNIKNAERIWDSDPQGIDRFINDILKNDTRESYINRRSEFSTYAVITEDGEWYSKDDMDYLYLSSKTEDDYTEWTKNFYDCFIKKANKDSYFVIVDCHI